MDISDKLQTYFLQLQDILNTNKSSEICIFVENYINEYLTNLTNLKQVLKIQSVNFFNDSCSNIIHDLAFLITLIDPSKLLMFQKIQYIDKILKPIVKDIIDETFITKNINNIDILSILLKKDIIEIVNIGTCRMINNYILNLDTCKTSITKIPINEKIINFIYDLNKEYQVPINYKFFYNIFTISKKTCKTEYINNLFINLVSEEKEIIKIKHDFF